MRASAGRCAAGLLTTPTVAISRVVSSSGTSSMDTHGKLVTLYRRDRLARASSADPASTSAWPSKQACWNAINVVNAGARDRSGLRLRLVKGDQLRTID